MPEEPSLPVAPVTEPEFGGSEGETETLGGSEAEEPPPEPEPVPAPLPIPSAEPTPPVTQGTPPAGGRSGLIRNVLIVGAVALLAALAAWVVLAKPFDHGPSKTVAVTSSPPLPTTVVSPSPSGAVTRPEPVHKTLRTSLVRHVVVATKPPPTKPPPTPVPATPAKAVVTEPPPTPKKPPAPPAAKVTIDNFFAVRTLPRRVCVRYKVENVTSIEITNQATGATIYTRNLDVANGRVAESLQPICLRRGATVLEYELQASGPAGEAVRPIFLQPREPVKKQGTPP